MSSSETLPRIRHNNVYPGWMSQQLNNEYGLRLRRGAYEMAISKLTANDWGAAEGVAAGATRARYAKVN